MGLHIVCRAAPHLTSPLQLEHCRQVRAIWFGLRGRLQYLSNVEPTNSTHRSGFHSLFVYTQTFEVISI